MRTGSSLDKKIGDTRLQRLGLDLFTPYSLLRLFVNEVVVGYIGISLQLMFGTPLEWWTGSS